MSIPTATNPIEGMVDRIIAPFNRGLAETGYVVGRNVALVSTPLQKCIGSPEQKYISDAGKEAPRTGGLFVRHQA